MYLLVIEEEEQNVSEHGERGHDSGIAAAGLIFQQARVFSPVVATFDAAPVSPNERKPLFGGVGLRRCR